MVGVTEKSAPNQKFSITSPEYVLPLGEGYPCRSTPTMPEIT